MAAPTFSVDHAHNSLTITADLITDAQTAWELWANPRALEHWWGPPEHPCVVTHFDLQPGGSVSYVMTGPDGTRYPGWWEVISVDAPHELTIRDGFGESSEQPSPEMPVATSYVRFTEIPRGIRMTIESHYASPEELQRALDLDMQNGFLSALGQITFLEME
jgi:uncharacterized protein YndB with AHSA1/START domain